MDLVESEMFTTPMILLQTVIEEVRHRSLPLYNRLKALIKTDSKRIWVFYNEYRMCVILLCPSALVRTDIEKGNRHSS